MTTKLTLTVDDAVIRTAKVYAKKKGESLSNIVENYLKSLATPETKKSKISSEVRSLMGVIEVPKEFDYKKGLGSAIRKRFGK